MRMTEEEYAALLKRRGARQTCTDPEAPVPRPKGFDYGKRYITQADIAATTRPRDFDAPVHFLANDDVSQSGGPPHQPRPPRPAMSEDDLRVCYRKLATALGWKLLYHTHNSHHSDEGWPDDVLGHEGAARVVFVEAKNATRPATPKQVRWLALLTAAGHEAHLWRPAQWHDGTIERVLTPAGRT